MDTDPNLELLHKRYRNAKHRARYWSGAPSAKGRGYNPARKTTADADHEYEMALDDCEALADEIEAITGRRPRVPDPKREFNEAFAARVLPILSSHVTN